MRVNTRIVIDMATMETEHAEGYDYHGPVALCGGGSGSSQTTVDTEFNRRLATIYERQQDIADQYFSYWEEYQKPYEIEQTQANTELLPYETDAAKNKSILESQQAQASSELLPAQTELAKAQIADRQSTLGMMQPLKSEFFQQATEGVDVNSRVAQAQADVANGFAGANEENARTMSRMGVNPNSGKFAGVNASQNIAKAAAVAGARSQARNSAQDENFKRLQVGMQYGMGGS